MTYKVNNFFCLCYKSKYCIPFIIYFFLSYIQNAELINGQSIDKYVINKCVIVERIIDKCTINNNSHRQTINARSIN